MLKRFSFKLVFGIVFFGLYSCSGKKSQPTIRFSADSSSILIKNIDESSRFQLKQLMQMPLDSMQLVSVLCTPGDQDSLQMEEEVPGKLTLKGDSVLFHPDQPFIKGKNYLIESYIGIQFGNADKVLKGGLKYNLKPQQQILTR